MIGLIVRSGAGQLRRPTPEGTEDILSVAFSRDGSQLVGPGFFSMRSRPPPSPPHCWGEGSERGQAPQTSHCTPAPGGGGGACPPTSARSLEQVNFKFSGTLISGWMLLWHYVGGYVSWISRSQFSAFKKKIFLFAAFCSLVQFLLAAFFGAHFLRCLCACFPSPSTAPTHPLPLSKKKAVPVSARTIQSATGARAFLSGAPSPVQPASSLPPPPGWGSLRKAPTGAWWTAPPGTRVH